MNMSSSSWNFLAVLIAVLGTAKCESTAYPVIPNYLLECYKNEGLYHRANRMPSTFEYFLDLLKKVERSPTSRNMNARELSLALLHYLKLDGIQFIPSQTKFYPSDVVPFAPSGAEYFKHRLTLVGLVPRLDDSYITAFNETLTNKEMCNLHFMLSYSIDPYKRENEKCSPLFEDPRKKADADRRLEWDPYQNIHDYYRRNRRHINHEENGNEVSAGSKKTALSGKDSKKALSKPKRNLNRLRATPKTAEKLKNSDDFSRRKKRNSEGEQDKKLQVEEISVRQNHEASLKDYPREEKDKFTIGDQELLSGAEDKAKMGLQSVAQAATFGKYGGRHHTKFAHSTDESLYSNIIPGIPLSDCPVVNGIITTPFGSLAVGTVVAGIAAGLNPEEIPPTKLSVNPTELESPSDRIKNTWATTLAGAVADTISSSALLDMQILKGGWNDSSNPKWYLLADNQFSHINEVALRGSLDGLFLGTNAKEWTEKFSGFKLSQMLEIYYDCCWGTVGAKHRVQSRPKYAPDEIFRKQVHLMSLVLKKQKTNFFTILDYSKFVTEAVDKVIQHIQRIDDREKSYMGSFISTKIDNSINMIAVVDSSWGHESLYQIFQVLRQARVANTFGNNLTVICGKDGKVLATSENSADFHTRFTKEMLMDNCSRGMDLHLVFETLDPMYRKIFHDEKTSQKMNTDSQVAVLFPFEQISPEDSYLIERSKNFRSNFPDVRLMVASNGRSESFLNLVNSSKDLFSLELYSSDISLASVQKFADGVKQSFQRISRPSCGSYFDDETPGTETRVTRDVGLGSVAYYRLSPQYFYTQHGQATITVRSKQTATLTVCHSREMERPALPTPRTASGPDYNYNSDSDYSPDFPPEARPYEKETPGKEDAPVKCKTITTDSYKIELNNPCEGAPSLRECQPLYISLSPPLQETVRVFCPTCRLPTDVQYEISVTGLTCYNSATNMLVSPFLLFFLLIHYSLKY